MKELRRILFASSSVLILMTSSAFARQINPTFDPDNFDNPRQNRYFPLVGGMVWTYKADNGETETAKVLTADEGPCTASMEVEGLPVFVVYDQVSDESGPIEETCDWYAPDNDGNVWYLGEDSTELPSGSKEGSWEGGVDGAEPGIIMEADPQIGDKYRQEFAQDVAEDVGQVIGRPKSVSVDAGNFDDCIQTLDSSRLAPGDREHKYYCADVGLVLEVEPKGGRGRNELQ